MEKLLKKKVFGKKSKAAEGAWPFPDEKKTLVKVVGEICRTAGPAALGAAAGGTRTTHISKHKAGVPEGAFEVGHS